MLVLDETEYRTTFNGCKKRGSLPKSSLLYPRSEAPATRRPRAEVLNGAPRSNRRWCVRSCSPSLIDVIEESAKGEGEGLSALLKATFQGMRSVTWQEPMARAFTFHDDRSFFFGHYLHHSRVNCLQFCHNCRLEFANWNFLICILVIGVLIWNRHLVLKKREIRDLS